MRHPHKTLDDFLTYKMHRLMKQHDRRITQSYAELTGLNLAEARVLAVVGTAGALTNAELARRANLDKSQASRGADGLVRQGLVSRGPNDHDGRAVKVTLTPAGRAVYAEVIAQARKHYEALFAVLDEEEHDLYERLLDKLLARSEALD
ncbi:Transcriptional regulator AdcR [Pandoraea terrae]|uniref:Transcriptional regulator AdcR n=1 Tax=Pandoraea terrae TaxID=1537710 RepID=A0A5E4V4Z5_9BURK|nr:MarR family transcriptional regulator [Pandoraea terrae]VVE07328.1 Transcriptional regulator AdcR [Pandoraea terrae]